MTSQRSSARLWFCFRVRGSNKKTQEKPTNKGNNILFMFRLFASEQKLLKTELWNSPVGPWPWIFFFLKKCGEKWHVLDYNSFIFTIFYKFNAVHCTDNCTKVGILRAFCTQQTKLFLLMSRSSSVSESEVQSQLEKAILETIKKSRFIERTQPPINHFDSLE